MAYGLACPGFVLMSFTGQRDPENRAMNRRRKKREREYLIYRQRHHEIVRVLGAGGGSSACAFVFVLVRGYLFSCLVRGCWTFYHLDLLSGMMIIITDDCLKDIYSVCVCVCVCVGRVWSLFTPRARAPRK